MEAKGNTIFHSKRTFHIITVENEYQKVARTTKRNILLSIDFLLKE
jgi:hypothetical protein